MPSLPPRPVNPSDTSAAPAASARPDRPHKGDRAAGAWTVREDEIECTAIRAQGAGGQNVNKVSSAIHLRFSVPASSLPEPIKERLLALRDHRITACGTVVIKAQTTRSQEQNRADAVARLQALVDSVAVPPTARKATRPTRASQRRRLDGKATRGEVKRLRGPVSGGD